MQKVVGQLLYWESINCTCERRRLAAAREHRAARGLNMRYDPCWASTKRPKSRAARWEQRGPNGRAVPRERVPDTCDGNIERPLEDPRWPAAAKRNQAEEARVTLLRRARALWGSPEEYKEALRLEALEDPILYEAISQVFHCQTGAPRSYRARMTDVTKIERFDAKMEKQVRDAVSVMRRRRSQKIIPFSTAARSVSYFNQRTPHRVWADQQRGMRIGDGTAPCPSRTLLSMFPAALPPLRCCRVLCGSLAHRGQEPLGCYA